MLIKDPNTIECFTCKIKYDPTKDHMWGTEGWSYNHWCCGHDITYQCNECTKDKSKDVDVCPTCGHQWQYT